MYSDFPPKSEGQANRSATMLPFQPTTRALQSSFKPNCTYRDTPLLTLDDLTIWFA